MSYNHDHDNEVNYFAKTNFRNKMTKFGIKTDDRRRHIYVIGKTGMGKTVLLENLILSDIYSGHGCCYVDPHGDTAEKLIDFIPSWRMNDVVYFNPADMDYPVGFNILEAVSESHKHLVVSGMMGVFQKIWENMWSSRMEYILNNTLLALLDNPGQTLLGINRMLSDAEFRKRIVGNVKDPVVKQFWLVEFASYNEKYAQEAVAPIQNKIGQFLSAVVIRNIVAQVKSTINVREIMDSEKIFIINLSKGRIGEDNSRLLGGLLITKMQLAAMERVEIPESERKDFYLYVDEFQNFAVESFAGILSEARKYRLCLTMAHQYVAQLTEEVRDAVFGNVGTIITFRVGAPDATFMEAEFMPRFTPEDIINLPKYNVYIKLLIDGVTSQPFSALTLPPIAQVTNSEEKVIKVSRERYAQPRSVIEEKILQWSGMEGADMDTLLKAAEDKKKASKDSKKPRHEYKCTRCGKEVILPVELDRSRPIYCDECIELVRDERKGGKKSKPFVPKPSQTIAPHPTEGTFVEKVSPDPAVSLDVLIETKQVPTTAMREPEPPHVVKQTETIKPAVPEATSSVSKQEYHCSDCGKDFHASVKLDRSRPAFCEECLKKIRDARKNEQTHAPVSIVAPAPPSPFATSNPLKKKRRHRGKKSGGLHNDSRPVIAEPNVAQKHVVPAPSLQASIPPRPVPAPSGIVRSGQSIKFE
ncbi:MAG: type IV secretion system DNA-binding domain-containing protein [Patescibacteria group bacterium]